MKSQGYFLTILIVPFHPKNQACYTYNGNFATWCNYVHSCAEIPNLSKIYYEEHLQHDPEFFGV